MQLNESLLQKGEQYQRELEREYKAAITEIEKDIEIWLKRLADNNGISLSEAKKLLREHELDEFHWSVYEYIKKGKENALNQRWMKELENASAKVHISRYEALLMQIRQRLELLYKSQDEGMKKVSEEILSESYYYTIYEVQKRLEQGMPFARLNDKAIEMVISKPWAADGKTFSDRIWGNKEKLISELQTNLTQSLIRGDPPDKAIKAISQRLNVTKQQAGRLVMTESAFFATEGQRRAYEELEVEQYEIVATLDSHTSEICRSLDGKVLPMKDYSPGNTAPPFHPWCRTVTVPYFDDNFTQRAARGSDGRTYYVDGDMSYNDWWNSLSEDEQGKLILDRKKSQNYSRDKKQYEKYKEILGDQVPKSFDKFQEMKYNDVEKWEELQLRYQDEKLRTRIRSDAVIKTIEVGKQGKHIKGHNNYIQGRSYLLVSMEEAQKLVNKYAGTGILIRDSNGNWSNKEIVKTDKDIGVYININTGIEAITDRFIIHYSKKGVHIVPAKKEW